MSSRQAPLVSQLADRVGQFVQTCASVVDTPPTTSSATAGEPSVDCGPSVTGSSRTASSSVETESAVFADPNGGPTSRTEVLEYGMTPEEYVHAVLERHDGRLKQRRFMDDYDWSSATVSRLLSDLEDQGAVERYRLGREKVVCLPDAAPRLPNAD